jgi:para-nitrobenzyl esterase
VSALLGAPAAQGVFGRASVQSGGVHVHTVGDAERAAQRLASLLGLARCDRESLGRVPATELVAATEELGRRRPDPGLLPQPFLPVVDGVVLPRDPLLAVAGGSAAGVDLLIGTNRDELTLFSVGNPALAALDEDGVLRWLENSLPGVPPDEVMSAYRAAREARGETASAHDVWVAAGSDIVFRWPSLRLASAHVAQGGRAFVYLFDWESPAFGGILGSCHALELPFVFGAIDVPAVQLFTGGGPEASRLSRRMRGAWAAFAHKGDPARDDSAPWPAWDHARRATMVFGATSGVADAPRDEELAVLERYRPLPAG